MFKNRTLVMVNLALQKKVQNQNQLKNEFDYLKFSDFIGNFFIILRMNIYINNNDFETDEIVLKSDVVIRCPKKGYKDVRKSNARIYNFVFKNDFHTFHPSGN